MSTALAFHPSLCVCCPCLLALLLFSLARSLNHSLVFLTGLLAFFHATSTITMGNICACSSMLQNPEVGQPPPTHMESYIKTCYERNHSYHVFHSLCSNTNKEKYNTCLAWTCTSCDLIIHLRRTYMPVLMAESCRSLEIGVTTLSQGSNFLWTPWAWPCRCGSCAFTTMELELTSQIALDIPSGRQSGLQGVHKA